MIMNLLISVTSVFFDRLAVGLASIGSGISQSTALDITFFTIMIF